MKRHAAIGSSRSARDRETVDGRVRTTTAARDRFVLYLTALFVMVIGHGAEENNGGFAFGWSIGWSLYVRLAASFSLRLYRRRRRARATSAAVTGSPVTGVSCCFTKRSPLTTHHRHVVVVVVVVGFSPAGLLRALRRRPPH